MPRASSAAEHESDPHAVRPGSVQREPDSASPTPRPALKDGLSSPSQVLALQRLAGNRAVANAIQARTRGDPARPAPRDTSLAPSPAQNGLELQGTAGNQALPRSRADRSPVTASRPLTVQRGRFDGIKTTSDDFWALIRGATKTSLNAWL